MHILMNIAVWGPQLLALLSIRFFAPALCVVPLFWQVVGVFSVMVRAFAGVEDFARTNAHHPRRRFILGLALPRSIRCCLLCLAPTGQRILDSEWHALLECPSHNAARGRFVLATGYSRAAQIESTSDELKDIVT